MDDARDALRRRYLFGECMRMAATLSHLLDLPIVAIHDDVWRDVPRHVGVACGHDLYGDARGLKLGRAGFLSGYEDAGATIRPIGLADMHRIWGTRVQCWTVADEDLRTLGIL